MFWDTAQRPLPNLSTYHLLVQLTIMALVIATGFTLATGILGTLNGIAPILKAIRRCCKN